MANEHFFPADFAGFAVPFADAAFGFHPANDQPAESSATAHFDSALSSLVSSPANGTFAPDDDAALGDLIGRLGSICSGGGANASCYSTPLSSPHRGPAARAHGELSRVSSSKSLGAPAMAPDNAPQYNEAEMSSKQAIQPRQDPPVKAAGDGSGRKRKAATGTAKGKASTVKTSTAAESDSSPKRSKVDGDGAERKEEKGGGEAKAAAPEPPKDYIHVRARRGQATDTHSLAERVRRERISERMRMLQSLVPGCNKITGKAVMLDEIINYVQSLQRQVEFLSMKLATMNPHLDFNGQCLQPRDMHQVAMVPGYPTDAAFSHAPPPRCSLLHDPFGASVHDGLAGKPPPLDSFGGDAFSQVGAFWEQDLQSVVQMGAGQSQDAAALSLQGFYGPAPVNHMKVEP